MNNSSDTVSTNLCGKTASPVIDGLLSPQAYNHATHEIHMLETHCAWVLLTGEFAYKIKKPVNFGFLDYSTLEKRRFYCEEELRLNRRFAPDVYLDVVSVNGTVPDLRIEGSGPIVEYAVKMLQFPEDGLLSHLGDAGLLNEELIDQMIERVSAFHLATAVSPPESRFGKSDQVNHWLVENFTHIRAAIHAPDEIARLNRMQDWAEREHKRLESVLISRKNFGFIRECHGDLHLGNMTLIDGTVTFFDCIEFNPELRWIDVMSETAFVLMDLEERGFRRFANRFLNGYLHRTGDYYGLQPLRWYMVYRALVRAKVAVLRGRQQDSNSDMAHQLQADYQRHMLLGEGFMKSPTPAMLLMQGLSGSGKSTVAQWISGETGMIQLRSDVERKRLSGLAPLDQSRAAVGEGLYTDEQTERTYERLLELAAGVIAAGYAVIVDATFLKRENRERFMEMASDAQIPGVILTCTASDRELRRRIGTRARSGRDPSDATIGVLEAQRSHGDALGADEWAHAIQVKTDTGAYQGPLLEALRSLIDI